MSESRSLSPVRRGQANSKGGQTGRPPLLGRVTFPETDLLSEERKGRGGEIR